MKKLIIYFLICLSFFSCNNKKADVYSVSDGGLLYLYHEQSNSELLPQDGNKLLVSVKYYNEQDSLLFNSDDISQKFIMDFFPPVRNGATINDAFAMMHEGDSVSFKINAYEFYLGANQTNMLSRVKKTDYLRFEIRLKKILSPEIVEKEFVEKDKMLKDEEEFLLDDFLKKNYPELKPTKSGLYFIETREGSGRKVGPKDSVAIHYTAMYINGEPIYSTYQKNDPLIFAVSDPNVWPCLSEAVQYMKKGSKATIIAVSKLAAGERGDKSMRIAPRKTIIFDLELIAYK